MSTLKQHLYEPVNALTHLFGAFASIIGLMLLLQVAQHNITKMISLTIYGLSMLILYLASTLMHGVKTNHRIHYLLNRFDHMAIFLLIAGTYTPIVYNLYPKRWGMPILSAVWLAAFIGMGFKLFGKKIHGFFNVTIYLILSWGGVIPLLLAIVLWQILHWHGVVLLLLGGFVYSVGFLIYYLRKPDPWPHTFGHHEIWHLFVLGGSFLHYLFIYFYVALPN